MAVKLYRGDTWTRTWLLQRQDRTPIDLTGATARLQVRDTSGNLMLEASTVNGKITITPAEGRIDMVIPYDAMIMPIGKYRYDLEITYANGVRRTYDSNLIEILEDITYG
jgi:hypothetical protein